MKLKLCFFSALLLIFTTANGAILGDCSVLKVPTIESDPYFYVNPNASCSLDFSLPGLPKMRGGTGGSSTYDRNSCGIFHKLAQDALNQVQSDLGNEIKSIDPAVANAVGNVVNSQAYQTALSAASDTTQQNGAAVRGVVNTGVTVSTTDPSNPYNQTQTTQVSIPGTATQQRTTQPQPVQQGSQPVTNGTQNQKPSYNPDAWFKRQP